MDAKTISSFFDSLPINWTLLIFLLLLCLVIILLGMEYRLGKIQKELRQIRKRKKKDH